MAAPTRQGPPLARTRIVPAIPLSLEKKADKRTSSPISRTVHAKSGAPQQDSRGQSSRDHSASTNSNTPLTPTSSNAPSVSSGFEALQRRGANLEVGLEDAPAGSGQAALEGDRPRGKPVEENARAVGVEDLPTSIVTPPPLPPYSQRNPAFFLPVQTFQGQTPDSAQRHIPHLSSTSVAVPVGGTRQADTASDLSHTIQNNAKDSGLGNLAGSMNPSPIFFAPPHESHLQSPTSPLRVGTVHAPPFYPSSGMPFHGGNLPHSNIPLPQSHFLASPFTAPSSTPLQFSFPTAPGNRGTYTAIMPQGSEHNRPLQDWSGMHQTGKATVYPALSVYDNVPSSRVPSLSTDMDLRSLSMFNTAMPSMQRYVTELFETSRFSDVLLSFKDGDTDRILHDFRGHTTLLARSPRISAEIGKTMDVRNDDGIRVMSIGLPGTLVTSANIRHILAILYGLELAGPDESGPLVAAGSLSGSLRNAFGRCIAAGILEMPAQHEWKLLSTLIDRDSLITAMELFTTARKFAEVEIAEDKPRDLSGNTSGFRMCLVVDECAEMLLSEILRYVTLTLRVDFKFDSSLGRSTEVASNIFSHSASRSSVSNPRLSRLQFGELGSETVGDQESHDSLVSKVLVDLPFRRLGAFGQSPEVLQKLGSQHLIQVMEAIVAAREARRRGRGKAKGEPLVDSDSDSDESSLGERVMKRIDPQTQDWVYAGLTRTQKLH